MKAIGHTFCRGDVGARNNATTDCNNVENAGNSIVNDGGARKNKRKRGPKPKKTRTRTTQTKHRQFELLLQAAERSPEARENLKALIAARREANCWRGLTATPPGSLLEVIISTFYQRTDFPLEIPFFATLHFVAAWLLRKGAIIDFAGRHIRPDIWTVVLASSGSGKTWVTNYLEPVLQIEANFPEPASAAKFVADLMLHNRGLWIRDEFAQLLRGIEQHELTP